MPLLRSSMTGGKRGGKTIPCQDTPGAEVARRPRGRRVASTPGREHVPLSRTLRSAARPRRHARQPGETGGEEKQRGGFGDRRPVAILDDRLPPERIAESESARAVREIVPRSVGA